jgi:hypothetical protein
MKASELKQGDRDDGFRDPYFGEPENYVQEDYVEWQNNDHTQSVYYLHGALHLFYKEGSLQKYCWSRTGVRLIEQINDALEKQLYPLIVAEGTSPQKLDRIQRSNYLGHNYRSFSSIGGSLFVYGLSFSENDTHIMERIKRNRKLKSLNVGVYGDPDNKQNKRLMQTLQALAKARPQKYPLELSFYDAATAQVWR